jgi:3-hydroxyisobutyrate dehydrogenase-like beta-hydroxyacid dehydrogenase
LIVAVVGLGSMGSRIAGRLLDTHYDVLVWNRSRAKTATLVERGAVAAATPADAAARADVLITMVADPKALREVTHGATGIAAGATPSLTVIDMSTVGIAAIADLADALPEHTALLDAPVLGSIGEAETGSLTIFVGGPHDAVERSTTLLSALGSPIHVGPLGSGQAAKLVANASLFGTIALVGEAVALARGLGLPADAAYDVLAATPLAAQARRRRAAIEDASYPPRFRLGLARKDADLISDAAADAGVDLRLFDAVRSWLADAAAHGFDERDYTAVLATILGCNASPTTG